MFSVRRKPSDSGVPLILIPSESRDIHFPHKRACRVIRLALKENLNLMSVLIPIHDHQRRCPSGRFSA